MGLRSLVVVAALTLVNLAGGCSGGSPSPSPAPPASGKIQVQDSSGAGLDHSIAFGSVTVGSSATTTVKITNVGSKDLLLGQIPKSNPLAYPFALDSSACSTRRLVPSGSCTMTVTFTAASAASFADSFDIPSGDPDVPVVTVNVGGAGTALPGKVIQVNGLRPPTDPLTLAFSPTGESRTTTLSVTITSIGANPLTLGTIGGADPLGGAFALDLQTCTAGRVLATGQTCAFYVVFTPPAIASYSDTFDIPSDADALLTATMAVRGDGIGNSGGTLKPFDSAAPFDDRLVAFGEVPVGTKARHVVYLMNVGSTDVTLSSLPYNDRLAAPFSFAFNDCPSPMTPLTPGRGCSITIEFAPTSAGPFTDTFDWNASDRPVSTMSVSGTGGTPAPFATAPLPRTGQSTCHDAAGAAVACAGTALDGELQRGAAWPAPRFVPGAAAAAGCVTDSLTGLVWTKDADLPAAAVTWKAALAWVAAQNAGAGLCGYTDWRLPNARELGSLVSYGAPDVAAWLNAAGQGFANVRADTYWTSTSWEGAVTQSNVLRLRMADGATTYGWTTDSWRVWAVRGGRADAPAPVPRTGQTSCYGGGLRAISCAGTGEDGALQAGFAWPLTRIFLNADGTMTDRLTGLTWPRDVFQQEPTCGGSNPDRTWQGARAYVACVNTQAYLGHTDWRLPNVHELRSLFHAGMNDFVPAALGYPDWNFPGYFWSSDSYAADPTRAWTVDVSHGLNSGLLKTVAGGYAWPVRGG